MEIWNLLSGWIAGAGTDYDLYLRDLAVSMVPGGTISVLAFNSLFPKLTFGSRFAGLSPLSSNPSVFCPSSFSCVRPPSPL